jgi:hypothetical protein
MTKLARAPSATALTIAPFDAALSPTRRTVRMAVTARRSAAAAGGSGAAMPLPARKPACC